MIQLKSIKDIQENGTEAVVRLRKQKLASGHPFMINSRKLPKGQCYLEFPSGIIKLATLSSTKREFIILKELDYSEGAAVRRIFHLTS
jgi:hypothetical protein